MSTITKQVVQQGVTYNEYQRIIDSLLREGKTTGLTQTQEYVDYTKLNVYRMHRIDIKLKLLDVLIDRLYKLQNNYTWLVIAEAWCGDAAQNLPILAKMSYVTSHIDFKIILRDEHPEIMQHYTTNGSMSIPKLICLNTETLEEVFTWGPRPASAAQLITDNKVSAEPLDKKALHEKLHLWYAQNKYMETQQELLLLIEEHLS
jgi:hypothetical protein